MSDEIFTQKQINDLQTAASAQDVQIQSLIKDMGVLENSLQKLHSRFDDLEGSVVTKDDFSLMMEDIVEKKVVTLVKKILWGVLTLGGTIAAKWIYEHFLK